MSVIGRIKMSLWGLSTVRRIGLVVGLLAFLALACNAPIAGETPSPPPPATSAETAQPTITPTESPTAESPTAETGPNLIVTVTPAVLPTFTPIQSTVSAGASPTLATAPTETRTPQAESQTSTPTQTQTSTPTKAADGGPLSFSYSIVWEVTGNSDIAIATVTVMATGGGGDYEYFRDDLPVDGPVFQYEWATCRANPGSLRVDSADGQSVRTDYYETPPCPQP
jgi:hypothetical protein